LSPPFSSPSGKRTRRGTRLRFEWRYWIGRTPWDSGITPPEVLDFLQRTAPGRALELGCGTGTNAVALAQRGWQVTAIDFSWQAVQAARRKARQAGVTVRFLRRDATRLDDLPGPFDLAVDIGCFHSLDPQARPGYATSLARLLRPGATYLLYTFLDEEDGWPAEADIRRLYGPEFELARLEHGEFDGRTSGWFTWTRRS
jgi:SAM-dependent methyltransferase